MRSLIRRCRPACVLLAVLLLAGPALATAQQQELEQGLQQLRDQQFEAALETFDQIIEENDNVWQAHFFRGMALGNLERIEEAQQSFLQAVELNPGVPDAHRMAAISSLQIEDWETAWDQAIEAQLAGADMSQFFEQLRQVSEEPADFEERLNTIRIAVANPDVSDAQADEQMREAVQQSQTELLTINQELGKLVADAGPFTLVQQAEAARYLALFKVQRIDVDDDTNQTDGMEGEIRLFEPGGEEPVWRRRISFRNLRLPTVVSELRRTVDFMVEWAEENGDGS